MIFRKFLALTRPPADPSFIMKIYRLVFSVPLRRPRLGSRAVRGASNCSNRAQPIAAVFASKPERALQPVFGCPKDEVRSDVVESYRPEGQLSTGRHLTYRNLFMSAARLSGCR